ncbi:hypothetical protein COCOBI_02-6560 [Coccomyxa sp. Obi]|nr:hypothetical protein COCOBI_02-6560 [Coccomyxa sp. Obi]
MFVCQADVVGGVHNWASAIMKGLRQLGFHQQQSAADSSQLQISDPNSQFLKYHLSAWVAASSALVFQILTDFPYHKSDIVWLFIHIVIILTLPDCQGVRATSWADTTGELIRLQNMKILERLQAVADCSKADLAAILDVLESEQYGYGRDDDASGSFKNVDAAQLALNEKRKNIVKTAVQAASGQETLAELPLTDYLQRHHGVSTKLQYLDNKYGVVYKKARPAQPGHRGRLPSTLRSLDQPFVREVKGHDGGTYPVEVGRQVELICRNHTVRAAIFFFAKIERNFISSSGNSTGLTRSVALMALIGAPGTGKTTALTELVHMIREHIEKHPQDCLDIIKNATEEQEEGDAEQTLHRLRNSVSEGRELVCWLRLDKDDTLRALEIEVQNPENTLALRLLYGFLTYFDSLSGPQSPAGNYQQFLMGLDRRVRVELQPEDAFAFLDLMTGQAPDTSRAVFIQLDEFNAARGPYPGDVPTGEDGLERIWAQKLLSTLIQFTEDQPNKSRLVLGVLGTSRHSVATLVGTSTPRSEIGPLPLPAPLVRDMQHFLRGIWGRVRLMVGSMERSCQAVEEEDSVVVQLASWTGGNFRLMAWMLELFGGARTVYDHMSWRAEKLANWFCAKRGHPDQNSVKSVLEALRGGMEGQNWFDKLGTLEQPVKLAIIQQAIAHALTGVTVQLRAPVLKDHPAKITWGDLLNEGLVQPMFMVGVTQEERRKRRILRVAESPVRTPVAEAHRIRAWHDTGRQGETLGFRDERALGEPTTTPGGAPPLRGAHHRSGGPSGGPGPQPPASPAPGAAPAPTGGPGSQSPATPAAGAAVEPAPHRTSPVMETVTSLGYRRLIDPAAKLSAANITIDLAPAVMAGLWRRIHNQDMSPLAETVYQESSAKKELVDLFCMMHPMYLRCMHLGKTHCSLAEVVRADWLAPWAAALRVELPEPRMLEAVALFKGQLKPDFFTDVRAVARAALDFKEGDSWPDLEERAQCANLSRPAVGISAANNYGTDTVLFVKLRRRGLWEEEKYLDILVQSKYTRGETSHTFLYALQEARSDTLRHNITAGEAPSVAALEGPVEPHAAKRRTQPRREAAEKGEQQRRQDSEQGGFPGGSMDDFEEAVLAAPAARLAAWEEQLEGRMGEGDIQPPDCPHPFLYCFVTDHNMLPDQHARLRVLSLAGPPFASRMVFIDRDQQKTFFGTSTAIQRNLAKLQENWAD